MFQTIHALYTAFDVYPSSKGAATHMHYFLETLQNSFPSAGLFALGNDKLERQQQVGNLAIFRFKGVHPNYLHRGEQFTQTLSKALEELRDLKLIHFRDIWGGLAALKHPNKQYQTIFEVNGLTSIELPYKYPRLPQSTLEKFKDLEQFCLENADQIIAPSPIIAQQLEKRNISASKIEIIPNGAVLPDAKITVAPIESPYIIYFGALQPWQGVDDLLRAMVYLQDLKDLKLVICSSHKPKADKQLRKMAEKLGITEKIIWKHQLKKNELYKWIRHAKISVAPLKSGQRNLEQGCCPLKILESMACGTPIISTQLPVVEFLLKNRETGWLVRPDRPTELARGIRLLLEYPQRAQSFADKALEHLKKHFLWSQQQEKLKNVYLGIQQNVESV